MIVLILGMFLKYSFFLQKFKTEIYLNFLKNDQIWLFIALNIKLLIKFMEKVENL